MTATDRPSGKKNAVAEIVYSAGSDEISPDSRLIVRPILLAALLMGIAQVSDVVLFAKSYSVLTVGGLGDLSFVSKLLGYGLLTSASVTCSFLGGLALAVGAACELSRRAYLRGRLAIAIGAFLLLADVWFSHLHFIIFNIGTTLIGGDVSMAAEYLLRAIVAAGIYASLPVLILYLAATNRLRPANPR